MILTYKPDGAEEQRWELQLGKLRSMETEAIEKHTGMAYGSEFKEALLRGNSRARRVLLWTFLRREHPRIKLDDVDFADDELVVEMDRDELQEARTRLVANEVMDPDVKSVALSMLDQQIADAPEPPGKAPASSSD